MSYYAQKCSSCDGPIYVTFPKADGTESTAVRIARGAVQIEFHQKKATHSGKHETIKKTWCVHCAPNGLVEFWEAVRPLLLNPDGADPERVLKGRRRIRLDHKNGEFSETTVIEGT